MKHLSVLPWLTFAQFWNSYWVLLFSWQYNYLHRFNKNPSTFLTGGPYLETLVMQPRLSYNVIFENDAHLISYYQMLLGTEVDLVGANAYQVSLGKIGLVTGFIGFSVLQVSEEVNSWQAQDNLRLLWGFQEERNSHQITGSVSEKGWWILDLASYPQEALQSPIRDSLWKLPANQI